MKQYEISRVRYYIGDPLKRAARRVHICAANIAECITGRWWCCGCRKYHAGRVVAFWPDGGLSDGCCSKHLTPEEVARCESITIGGFRGRDITERVKKEVAESEKE